MIIKPQAAKLLWDLKDVASYISDPKNYTNWSVCCQHRKRICCSHGHQKSSTSSAGPSNNKNDKKNLHKKEIMTTDSDLSWIKPNVNTESSKTLNGITLMLYKGKGRVLSDIPVKKLETV